MNANVADLVIRTLTAIRDSSGPVHLIIEERAALTHAIEAVQENERLRQTINNGSSLFAELFNRMPVKELKESVPIEIAKRIGDFMVSQGYRMVFDRWYLQAKPSPSSAIDKPMTAEIAEQKLNAVFNAWWNSLEVKPNIFDIWMAGVNAVMSGKII